MPSQDYHRGHRKRLREKFLKSGLSGFHDYEIIELLLSLGTPRKDCKVPAKEALKKYQTLRGVMEASALYESPFSSLHAGGPDALFVGNENVIEGIFSILESFEPEVEVN